MIQLRYENYKFKKFKKMTRKIKTVSARSFRILGIIGVFGLILLALFVPMKDAKADVVPVSAGIFVSPDNICAGGSALLSWSSDGATSVSINQGIGSVSLNGERYVSPNQTTTYTITGSNSGGGFSSTFITLNVSSSGSCAPSGGTPYVPYNNTTSSNVVNNTASGAGSTALAYSNNNVINSNNTTNIISNTPDDDDDNDNAEPEVTTKNATSIEDEEATLNGRVDGNDSSTRVWFEWGEDRDDLDETTSERSVGSGTTTFNARISNLDEDTTYYFRAVAENDEGIDYGSVLSFRTDDNGGSNNNDDEPDVTTKSATNIGSTSATLRGEVDGNGSSTRVWFEYGRSRSDLNEETDEDSVGSGNEDFTDRITGLRRDTTYYFRAVAENSDGESKGSIFSFRTDDDNNDDDNDTDSDSPTAITTSATGISGNSAQLNSLILASGDEDTNTWFEWGPTPNLGNQTREVDLGNQTSVRQTSTITGLVPGLTYYFRAVAENSDWRNHGSVLSFVTLRGTTYTPPVIRNTTTVINRGGGQNSLIMLTITDGSELITNGERREYRVTWKNISSQTLEDVVLRVILPHSMSFEASDKGIFSNADNTLAYNVETLRSGETGDLVLIANSGISLKENELVVVVADMVYTDQSDAQGDAVAYVTHKAYIGGSVLGAAAFGAGFLPSSLFGWLFLIILILILVLLIKYLRDQSRPNLTLHQDSHSHL